jgi:Sec-independent protein translocase protein TatA
MITAMIFALFLALVVFGPKKTVEMCGTVGRAMSQFKHTADQLRSNLPHREVPPAVVRAQPPPSAP